MRANKLRAEKVAISRETLEGLYAQSFHWALARCLYDTDAAHEVMQLTFVKVLEGSAGFDGRSAVKTWLFGVIRRTAQEFRRRQMLRGAILMKWQTDERTLGEPSTKEGSATETNDEKKRILESLGKLPARQREVVELVFYQGLTLEEAAVAMEISVGSARTHYDRAKKALRNILNRE